MSWYLKLASATFEEHFFFNDCPSPDAFSDETMSNMSHEKWHKTLLHETLLKQKMTQHMKHY